jgi:hypothetical protein
MGQPFKDEGIRDSVVNLERHRWRLEENALKLQNSLRYWQTCEAEYESLKEEISGLGDDPTHAQLVSRRKPETDSIVHLKNGYIPYQS